MSSIMIEIANYHFIGLTNEEIKRLLKKRQKTYISLNSIQGIVYEMSGYIKRLGEEKIERVARLLEDNNSQGSIIKILMYKGVVPKYYVIRQIVADAVVSLVRENTVKLASKVVSETNSGHIVRDINRRFRLGITLEELEIQ